MKSQRVGYISHSIKICSIQGRPYTVGSLSSQVSPQLSVSYYNSFNTFKLKKIDNMSNHGSPTI